MEDNKKYEEALERARECLKDGGISKNTIAYLEEIFPELRESEDKRIRKALFEYFTTSDNNAYYEVCGVATKKILAWLENKDEQKPSNKVEPKFKVGDWIVYDNKIVCHIDNIYHGKFSLMYTITDSNNMCRSYSVKGFDNNAHLWTIQDTKPGDVLVAENGWTCIFKELEGENFSSYCYMDSTGYFFPEGGECHTLDERICGKMFPATKGQRELLFKYIKEAGYEWDAEKFELWKIEQKPAWWSRKDEQYLLICKNALAKYQVSDKWDADIISRWLENRLKTIPRHPHEWSEEDETHRHWILEMLKAGEIKTPEFADHFKAAFNWLNSLNPLNHWKPSEKQMMQLGWIAKQNESNMLGKELMTLYNDLKKLTE